MLLLLLLLLLLSSLTQIIKCYNMTNNTIKKYYEVCEREMAGLVIGSLVPQNL